MAFLFGTTLFKAEEWLAALGRAMPDMEFRLWPEVGDGRDIEFLLLQNTIRFDYATCPNLKAIFTFGAGVDHVLANAALPARVPVVRLTADGLVRHMTQYVQYAVLHYHRHFHTFRENQPQARWQDVRGPANEERRVGIMGLGELGRPAAEALRDMGFAVGAWSRTPKVLPGVAGFAGRGELRTFLARTDILVCLLPLTPETRGILDAAAFEALPRGAFVVNVGRGAHLVEADLIAALDRGHLARAMLDVFHQEPLAPDHPFWSHPKVDLTPHIAAWNSVDAAAGHIAGNVARIRRGEAPHPAVDRQRGY